MPNVSYPGDYCCTLWDNSNYGGASVHECIDASYSGTKHIDLAGLGFNDKTSSWWCGKSVDYTLCKDS